MRVGNLQVRPKSLYVNGNFITTNGGNGFELIKLSKRTSNPECWHGGYSVDGVYKPLRQEKDIPEHELPLETAYVIAFIDYDIREDDVKIDVVGSRLLELSDDEYMVSKTLMNYCKDEITKIERMKALDELTAIDQALGRYDE
jgi:hypothetical protein